MQLGLRELSSEFLPYPILEKCSNFAEDLIQPRFTLFPSTLSALCFAFQVQLKLFISLSFPMRARREVTTDGEVKTLHERKIIEAAAQALGKSFSAEHL